MKILTACTVALIAFILTVFAEGTNPKLIRSRAAAVFQGTVISLQASTNANTPILMKATIQINKIEKGALTTLPVTVYYYENAAGQICPSPVSLATNFTSRFAVTTATIGGLTNIFLFPDADWTRVAPE
jgi:hypothetical protein